ncbi:MAG: hypothetical protein AAF480_16225 [Actinomycetota bacterium]
MSERLPSLRVPPIAFATGGASAVEAPHGREAFELALRLGATGLETNVWLSGDGEPVVAASPKLRVGLRRLNIESTAVADLGGHAMTLTALVAATDAHLSLGVADTAALDSVLARVGEGDRSRLWFRSTDGDRLREWRSSWPDILLVDDARLADMAYGPERRAASLGADGIDAVRMPYPDWTGGIATLFHRFEVLAFGWDAVHDRMLADLIRMGLDGIATPHPDRLLPLM